MCLQGEVGYIVYKERGDLFTSPRGICSTKDRGDLFTKERWTSPV